MFNLGFILALTLVFGYLNGLNGAANIVATMVSSRAMGLRQALTLATLCLCAGPFVLGVTVASTISSGLIASEAATIYVLVAGLVGAILWILVTLWLRIPSSTTQAFVGALVGAAWVGFGAQVVIWPGVVKTLAAIFLSPLVGMIASYWLVKLSYLLSASATPRVNTWFKRIQVVVSMLLAVAFGANDGQKIMGIIILGLMATGLIPSFTVPLWIMVFSAFAIGLGTLAGSWRLIHTLGGKFYKIRPIHGFSAQSASWLVILVASLLGGPVSASQVITSAIVGAGSADRIRMVRWQVVQQILLAWLLTIPLSGAIGAGVYVLLQGLRS